VVAQTKTETNSEYMSVKKKSIIFSGIILLIWKTDAEENNGTSRVRTFPNL